MVAGLAASAGACCWWFGHRGQQCTAVSVPVFTAPALLQSDIRPPGHAEAVNRQPLDGGARSVRCALCPIKYGAFKKAEDGQRWVHSVRRVLGGRLRPLAGEERLRSLAGPAAAGAW